MLDQSVDLQRRTKLVGVFSVAYASCGIVFAPLYFFFHVPSGGIAILTSDLLILCALVILRKTASPIIAGNWIIFHVYWLLGYLAYLNGGLVGPSLAWNVSIPIAATIMATVRSGIVWTFLVAVQISIFYLISLMGISLPQHFTPQELFFVGVVSLVFLGILIQMFANVYEHFINLDLKKIEYLSITDDMTGVFNRRGFMRMTLHQFEQAKIQNKRIVLMYADMDGLKQINDEHGHAAGDRAIGALANILKSTLRASDIIARIGGDEFLASLEEFPGHENLPLRIKSAVQTYNQSSQLPCALSISIGLDTFDPQLESVERKIELADQKMYFHKKTKNAVERRKQ